MRAVASVGLRFTCLALAVGCGSAPAKTSTGASSGVVSSDETWGDGMQLSLPVLIQPGVTVTIAPGATIHAADGVQITVQGTLKGPGGATATIAGTPTWAGILVDQGGSVTLTNVDLASAGTAIAVNAGAAAVSYDSGTITASSAPFAIQAGAKLTTSHAFVKGSLGTTRVQGELDASYLDYDAGGNDGITAESDGAVVRIDDSELHGLAGAMTDMIVSYVGAGTIHVAYTEIKDVHCAFHIERASNIDVSFVTATGDSFGAMLYGTLNTGTRTFESVNFTGELQWGIDEEDGDINGPITIDDAYIAGNAEGDVHLQTGSNISVTNPASAPHPDAHPR